MTTNTTPAQPDWRARLKKRMDVKLKALRRRFYIVTRKKFIPSAYGVRMAANWKDLTFNFCISGSYGKALSNRLAACSEPFIFIDIGANQGLYSLLAAQNPHCMQVLAFEPVKSTFKLLSRNVEANPGSYKTSVFQHGISDKDAMLSIMIPQDHSGAASIHNAPKVLQGSEPIKVKKASAIVGDMLPDLPIFVKIDVEGHEEAVIASLMATSFAPRIFTIFYEVDERWVVPLNIRKALRSKGFVTFTRFGKGQHYDVMAKREAKQA